MNQDIDNNANEPEFVKIGTAPAMVFDDAVYLFDRLDRNITYHPIENIARLNPDQLPEQSPLPYTPGEARNIFEAIIIPTTSCNLRCCYCYLGDNIGLDVHENQIPCLISALLNLSGDRDISFYFFGGEPSLAESFIRKFIHQVELIRDTNPPKCFSFGLATNGTLHPKFLTFLLKQGFYFSVSIDGPRSMHDRTRMRLDGSSCASQVEECIRTIASSGANLRTRTTITQDSLAEMPAIVNYLSNLGAKVVHFEPLNPYPKLENARNLCKRPTAVAFVTCLKKAIGEARKKNVSVSATMFHKFLFPSRYMCEGMSGHRIAISPHGIVSRCAEIQHYAHPLTKLFCAGSVKPEGCLNLNNDYLQNKILSVENSYLNLDKCLRCFAQSTCAGGCPAHNYQATGSAFIVDPFHCDTTREILKFLLHRILKKTLPPDHNKLCRAPEKYPMRLPREFFLYGKKPNQQEGESKF
ncbi:MAG: radical SAM protein [Deltaproteobacteria bacterium]|nr:radical SAM protein [Deltaproteobacteria bacterium]